MIRVMVVEDEPPIAQSIGRLAEDMPGVEVVHIAINGSRALEYMAEHPVDLVFSDIKMPVMDGIELARRLQEEYPEVVMVIISGFQEFEFARSAIRYGVNNYLLKPVSRERMFEVLEPACGLIRARREKKNRALLESAVHSGEPARQGEGERCGVLLIYCGPYPLIPDGDILDGSEQWDAADIEAWMGSRLPPGETCLCVHGRNVREWAAVFAARDEDGIRATAEAVFRHLSAGCDSAVTVAYGEAPLPLGQVGDGIRRLRGRIYKRIRMFCPQLLAEEDEAREPVDAQAEQNELLLALRAKDSEGIGQAAGALVDAHVRAEARQSELVFCLERILLVVYDGRLPMSRIGEMKFDLHSAVSTSFQAAELADELHRVFCSWLDAGEQPEGDDQEKLCESVAAYLRLSCKQSIRGAELAKRFNYSSSQLSKKFKEHFGLTISEYVTNYRIETAQAIMRGNRELKVKQVALEVGFQDQYYFSKTFKRITGSWPTEYINDDRV